MVSKAAPRLRRVSSPESAAISAAILTWNRNPIGYGVPPHNTKIISRLRYMVTGKNNYKPQLH